MKTKRRYIKISIEKKIEFLLRYRDYAEAIYENGKNYHGSPFKKLLVLRAKEELGYAHSTESNLIIGHLSYVWKVAKIRINSGGPFEK